MEGEIHLYSHLPTRCLKLLLQSSSTSRQFFLSPHAILKGGRGRKGEGRREGEEEGRGGRRRGGKEGGGGRGEGREEEETCKRGRLRWKYATHSDDLLTTLYLVFEGRYFILDHAS